MYPPANLPQGNQAQWQEICSDAMLMNQTSENK